MSTMGQALIIFPQPLRSGAQRDTYQEGGAEDRRRGREGERKRSSGRWMRLILFCRVSVFYHHSQHDCLTDLMDARSHVVGITVHSGRGVRYKSDLPPVPACLHHSDKLIIKVKMQKPSLCYRRPLIAKQVKLVVWSAHHDHH